MVALCCILDVPTFEEIYLDPVMIEKYDTLQEDVCCIPMYKCYPVERRENKYSRIIQTKYI